MSTASIDSLTWIKAELEQTLEAARRRLDAYSEERDNQALFDEFIDHTHQVAGTFAMLAVRGGQMLAEHIESMARAVRDERVNASPEIFELLMRANLELTEYLDRMVSGMRDSPAVLMSVTNEIRVYLGDEPLERERLAPRERVPLPEKPSGEDIVSLAAQLRPRYQLALLDFYRERRRDQALVQMREVVSRLECAAITPPVFEFLWVMSALLEALTEKALAPSLAINRVLGQFERELKRLATSSEAAMAETPPESLVHRILGELENVQQPSEHVTAVRDAFRLEEGGHGEQDAASAGPGATLLHTAGGAVLEDLARVRDRIDIFVRTGSRNPSDLAPLTDTLKKVGDALGMLKLDTARQHVEREREAVRALADKKVADQADLLALATGLIAVESDVESYLAGAGKNPQALAERSARFAGLREALAEISRVKDNFNEYLRASDPSMLKSLPDMIARLSRTLDFLALDEAAGLIRRIGAYVVRIQADKKMPERDKLDCLADAVVSVEYHLEMLQHGREAPASMLENADRALQVLQVDDADAEASLPKPQVAVAPEQKLAPTSESEATGSTPETQKAPAVEGEQSTGTEQAVAASSEEVPELPAVREPGADLEIVSIFMDEAAEVREALDAALPAWQTDPDDREALAVIRRSFHTLKGSGRMVGALRLGEFCWAYENLLNRVIDYTLPPAEPVINALAEAIGALDGLLVQFDNGAEPGDDIPELFARAWQLARGEGLPSEEDESEVDRQTGDEAGGSQTSEAEPVSEQVVDTTLAADELDEVEIEARDDELLADSTPSTPEEATEDEGDRTAPELEADGASDAQDQSALEGLEPEDEAEPIPRLEPVLYGIYRRETEEHFAVIQNWLDALVPGEPARVSAELYRAVHTLSGSATMAGVEGMRALFSPFDIVLQRIGEDKTDPTGHLPVLLGEAQSMGWALLFACADDKLAMPDWPPVAKRMAEFQQEFKLSDHDERPVVETFDDAFLLDDDAPIDDDLVPELPPEEPELPPASTMAPESGEKSAANVADLQAQDDYDAELAQIFVGEANELLDNSDAAAHAWSQNHDLLEPLAELLRHLHTLKGGARMAGIAPVSDLTHELESVLTRVSDGRIPVSEELLRLVERALDRLHRMLTHVLSDGKIPLDATIITELRAHARIGGRTGAGDDADEEFAQGEDDDFAAFDTELEEDADEQAAQSESDDQSDAALAQDQDGQTATHVRHEMARVRADLLETSINNTGEVSIYRARIEEQLRSMSVHITELDRTADRLRNQLRELEAETEAQILSTHEQRPELVDRDFDPLEFDRYTRIHELSRSLAEAASDLTSLRTLFATDLSQANVLLERQARVNADLQDALMRTRMVPFSLSAPRLRRIVRRVAEEQGKPVEFNISGAQGEMDRQLVGHILPALEHLLRNAVAHGIEDSDRRAELGKPETAQIMLALKRDGGDMVIEVTDDGSGLDMAAIRAKASEQGLIQPDSAVSDKELVEFIFRPGFTTSTSVTQTAGRGVGMDVVASEARQVGGTTEVETKENQGTCCRIRLPATLAITQTLLVKIGQTQYPVALASISGIARLQRSELEPLLREDNPQFEYGGESYDLVSLATTFGEVLPPEDERATRQPLLLVNTGGRHVALVAEDMSGSREVVVKPVGPQIAGIPGIAGATIFGDGSIGLLLDLTSLVRGLPELEYAHMDAAEQGADFESRVVEEVEPLVMVVDDSITVRRVTQRLLERNGMRVLTAKDGVEALDLLQESKPDIALLDIEMPRMDGYELAGHMKNDAKLRGIPIIVITSRTGEKHRARAEQIGIEHYLGKPYQDAELIAAVQQRVPRLAAKMNLSNLAE